METRCCLLAFCLFVGVMQGAKAGGEGHGNGCDTENTLVNTAGTVITEQGPEVHLLRFSDLSQEQKGHLGGMVKDAFHQSLLNATSGWTGEEGEEDLRALADLLVSESDAAMTNALEDQDFSVLVLIQQ